MHRIALAIVIAMLSVATYARGQERPNEKLADTQAVVVSGDFVRVIDSKGEVVRGTIVRLTSESVQVKTGKRIREWKESDLREIQMRQDDPLSNGILFGALAGIGGGLAVAYPLCGHPDKECETIVNAIFVPVGIGTGIAIGALLDSTMHRFRTVFRAPQSSTRSFQWKPVLSRDRKGMTLAFRF